MFPPPMNGLQPRQFKARSDDGKYETTIQVIRKQIDASSMDNPVAHIGGLALARTVDGLTCTPTDDGGFKVFDPKYPGGVVVRKVK